MTIPSFKSIGKFLHALINDNCYSLRKDGHTDPNYRKVLNKNTGTKGSATVAQHIAHSLVVGEEGDRFESRLSTAS